MSATISHITIAVDETNLVPTYPRTFVPSIKIRPKDELKNMKQKKWAHGCLWIVISLSLVMVGCSREQPNHRLLLDAEQQMDNNPMRAMEMAIRCMADSTAFNDADSALYGLVITESVHKLRSYILSDSLIGWSARYYEQHGDKNRLARAWLHYGLVMNDNHRTNEAVEYLKKAELLALQLNDNGLRHDVFEALGKMNDEANNRALAISYYRKTLETARKSGNVNWIAISLNNLASAYDRAGDAKRQAACSEECRPLMNKVDNHVKAAILTNQASIDIKQGYLASAKENLEMAMELEPQETTTKLYADLLALWGHTDMAVDYWYQSLTGYKPYVQIDAYQKLIAYYKQRGNNERALDLSQRLNRMYQHLKENTDTTNITELQTKFDKDTAESNNRRRLMGLVAALALLVATVLLLVGYHRHRMRRYEKIIDRMLSDYHKEEKSGHRQWAVDEQQLQSPVVVRLHSLATRGKTPQQEDWIELYALGKPFLSMLSSYRLSVKEINICMLSKLGFAPSEIATLTASSPQAITNSRIRLHSKIFKEKGGAKDFDSKIRKLRIED